jgi:hypothetical protein
VHESPCLGRNGEQLVAGDVVAVGARPVPSRLRRLAASRILVLVTEDGCENLTQFPYELS